LINIIANGIKKRIELFRYGCYANMINIDACNMCQLNCRLCKQRKEKNSFLGRGYLSFDNFKRFVDRYPNFKVIDLAINGEAFLNPELKNIIKYADTKKIGLSTANGSNLNTLTDEMAEDLVKYKFKQITVAIDGATEDTYKIYRSGGNFNKVIKNIKKINYYKYKYNAINPELMWQFVIFGYNEHELPIAKKMAEDLGMRFYAKLNWSSSWSPVKNKEFVKKYMVVATRDEFEQRFNKFYVNQCRHLWLSPMINWDGKLLGCCMNARIDFGNIFKSGLEKCTKGKKYTRTKNVVLGRIEPGKDLPCYYCGFYKTMKARKYYSDPYNTEDLFTDILGCNRQA